MAVSKWSSFYQYVAPDVFECPQITMDIAIRDSAIEFCRRTQVWQEQLDDIQTIAGVSTYDLGNQSSVIVEQVLEALCDGRILEPVKFRDLPANRDTRTGESTVYSMMFGDQVRLYPIPQSSGKLSLTVVYTPSNSSTGIDSTLFERYKEIIAHGAKHRLMTVPNKSWSNPALAQYHMTQFMRGIGEARIRKDNDMSHVVYNNRFR